MSFPRLKADGCFISSNGAMVKWSKSMVKVVGNQLDQVEAGPLVMAVEVKTNQEPQIAKDGTSSLTQG